MKSNVEEISPVKKKLIVEVEAEEVDKKIEKAYRDLGKSVSIPGFRKGRIPLNILEGRFGSQVLSDVTRDLVNESLPRALEESGAYPLTMPVIENDVLQKGTDFRYTAVMEVKPEINLGDYTGLEVEKEKFSVTKEEVEKQLQEIQRSRGQLHNVEENRGIREEDYVLLHYEGFENGEPVPGLKDENHMIRVGSGEFNTDLEARLVGLAKGNKEKIRVKFPDDYKDKNLAGKDIDFDIEILDIKEMELPALDDAFAQGMGAQFKTLEDVEREIEKELTRREESRVDREAKARLVEKICSGLEFDLPESLVDQELNSAVQSIKQNFERSGGDFEQSGLDLNALRENFREPAEFRVKRMLVLSEIAREQHMEVTEADLSKGFADLASGIGQDPGVIRRYYESNNLLEPFRDKLLEEKTLNWLMDNAKVNGVEPDKINKSGAS